MHDCIVACTQHSNYNQTEEPQGTAVLHTVQWIGFGSIFDCGYSSLIHTLRTMSAFSLDVLVFGQRKQHSHDTGNVWRINDCCKSQCDTQAEKQRVFWRSQGKFRQDFFCYIIGHVLGIMITWSPLRHAFVVKGFAKTGLWIITEGMGDSRIKLIQHENYIYNNIIAWHIVQEKKKRKVYSTCSQ